MLEGVISNPTNNPALGISQKLSQGLVDWTSALAQGSSNIIGVLDAWNGAKNNPPVVVPSTVNNTPQQNLDDKLQKGFFYTGIALVFIAGGVFLYKKI